nr:transposase (putative), gypsy type [Tanacetum cinerariifolium]
MHERHAGKIELYTRFFDFANFRLPLSTFLVDILGYFRINISQLSVIGAAKVSRFEILCRVYGLTPTVGLFRCIYVNSKKNGWMPFIKRSDRSPWQIFMFKIMLLLLLIPLRSGSSQRNSCDWLDLAAITLWIFVGGKSMSAVQRLFAGAVQNAKVRGEAIPTMPFVTSFVSAILEREGEGHTESITGLNLRTISAPQRFVISSDSSHHSGANIAKAEVDSFARPSAPVITATTTITSIAYPAVVVKEKIIEPSLFAAESTSASGTDPAMVGLTDLTDSDFLVGGIRTIINPDYDLQKTYVPQWNATNGSRLDDGGVCRKMVDEFAPPKLFASVREMEHDQLFTEFNVGTARQISLSAEVRMHAEYNISEKRRLKSVVKEKDQLLKAKDEEVENLKAQLLLKEAEATEAIRLRAETSKLETAEKSLRDEVNALNERNTTLEKERNSLDVKVTDLEAIVVSKERELTDSTTQLTFIKSQNNNLADQRLEEFQDAQLKVINDKFNKLYTDFVEMSLHLEERFYPHLLTTIVGHRWLLTYGMELAVTKCLNSPGYLSTLGTSISKATEKADYVFALQQLQSVNFPLLAELKANKDASIEAVMNILRLEEHLAERLSLNEIKENIMSHRSLFQDVFIPLAEPFSAAAVTGTEGTSDTVPATVDTTAALSVTFPSTSIVDPISIDDYEVRGSCFPSRSLNLYAPFPSAFVTSYGPSHLGPSFPVSSVRLASLLRSRLISKASLFCIGSTSDVLSVGMPISARMTAYVLYVDENGVSPLLDFIIVRDLFNGERFDAAGESFYFFQISCHVSFFCGICSVHLVCHQPRINICIEDDPSVNKIHGLGSSSSYVIRVSGESSSAFLPPLVFITPVVLAGL